MFQMILDLIASINNSLDIIKANAGSTGLTVAQTQTVIDLLTATDIKAKAIAGPAPTVTITSITPNPSPVGSSVTIAGTGFGTQGAGSSVAFNGAPASINQWSDQSIAVTIPPTANTGPVTVQTASGGSAVFPSFTVG